MSTISREVERADSARRHAPRLLQRHVRIMGTGRCVPAVALPSSDLDDRFGLVRGGVRRASGIDCRYRIGPGETAATLGAKAVQDALAAAEIAPAEVDCLIVAGTIVQQLMPHGAALILAELGWSDMAIPTLDCQAACLSSFAAIDIASAAIEAGRYEHVVVVAADVISPFLDPRDRTTYALYGDMAAALVLGSSTSETAGSILGASYRTYSAGVHAAEIRGGGSVLPAHQLRPATETEFFFHMDGDLTLTLIIDHVRELVGNLMADVGLSWSAIDVFIPHQTSRVVLQLMLTLFPSSASVISLLQDYGNVGAATLPLAVDEGIRTGQIRPGSKVGAIMCGAGFSIGAMIFEF